MADYRLSANIVGRKTGQSVVAAAAYRAGEKLRDERTGDIKDYTRRAWSVLYTQILTPQNAPQWMLDRQRLWNEVERREDQGTKPRTAQLARDLELSLPHELTHEQRVRLVCGFVQAEFVARGMVADIAIHAPPKRGDGTNHHAHILLTMRDIEGDGFGNKNRDWNRKDTLEHWRESWEDYQNRALEYYGHQARVDHRSLKDQGIDRAPTTHLGPNAQAMEDDGIATERGDENRRRKADNDNREQLKAQLADIDRQIAEVERLTKIVDAVEKGYQRVEQGARPDPQSPEMENSRQESYNLGPEASPMPDGPSDADKAYAEAGRKEQERQDEARKEQERLQQAFIAEDKRLKELGDQFRDRQIQLAQEFRKEQERIDALKQDPKRIENHLRELEGTAEGHRQTSIDRDEKKYLEGDIRDPGARYAQALVHYSIANPYESLAKVAMAEHASFRTDQETLARSIAKATDPKEREMLETRKLIEGYEYLMITGERIATMSAIVSGELINGRLESKESVRMRELINGKDKLNEKGEKIGFEDGYKQKAQQLRQKYRDLQAERTGPAKEQERPQSALDKIVADAKRQTQEPAPQRERSLSAAEKIVEDAKRQTPTPSPRSQPGPNQYKKDLSLKTTDPQENKDRQKQQELERKAQRDRDRER